MRYNEVAKARYARDLQSGQSVNILAIESSCDETAAAIVRDGKQVISSVVASQIATHQLFGGVVPEVASRVHVEVITRVVDQALHEAKMTFNDLQAIAVTYAPGLIGALFVGVTAAKSLAQVTGLPMIGVHHLAGHMYASALTDSVEPPYLALIVSGGHTELIQVDELGGMTRLGKTRDDAAGEAFDKIARALSLGYPGGPMIQKAAANGDPLAIEFPRAKMPEGSLDFSFSGLKSSVMLYLDRRKKSGEAINLENVAASFQSAVVEALVEKAQLALQQTGMQTLVLAGGVAANALLRQRIQEVCRSIGVRVAVPALWLCTDNAAMIGAAAYPRYRQGKLADLSLTALANLALEAW